MKTTPAPGPDEADAAPPGDDAPAHRGKSGWVDRRPPVERAVVLHPIRPGAARPGRPGSGSSGSGNSGSGGSGRTPQARLDEAVGLARALDLDVVAEEVVTLRTTAPATLFGKGRVAEIALRREALDAGLIVVDDALTPVQQRNLETAWTAKVVDRTGLILEIFARRARTREGKLQVELARLAYERSRLVRTWTHLERQRGGFGFLGGPGETQIEADRRLLAERIARLRKDLEEVRRTRGLQRSARRRAPYPVVALVGYTNAGKSTLFNRLTHAGALAQDMLFATLDPTLRALPLPGGRPAILSDTVGFISDLPHELVEAFRATLEEVQDADVILHVRDISAPDSTAEAEDVRQVLNQLEIEPGAGRLIEVWNKADRLDPEAREAVEARARRSGETAGPPAVLVSALTGEGEADLLARIADRVDPAEAVELTLAAADGEALAWVYRHGRVVERHDDADGAVHLTARLEDGALGRLHRLFPDAEVATDGRPA